MNRESPFVVIGAGPAGLTAALELARAGQPVEVYETDRRVGGMSASLDLWGQRVDLGPHRFFSRNARVNAFWREMAGENCVSVDRLTRILYGGKFFYYPLRPLNALAGLGPLEAIRCGFSYLSALFQRRSQAEAQTFEDWVSRRFGTRLYRTFFKTYSEKLWGIPCSRLDADFAAQRIKKFSLGEAVRTMFFGNSGKHATLCDRFLYPTGGTGEIYEKIAREIERLGGRIYVNAPVRGLWAEGDTVKGITLEDGSTRPARHVISTMPLTLAASSLSTRAATAETCAALGYRNTVLVYLSIDGTGLFPDNWIYVHSVGLDCGRITNFRNWAPSICGDATGTIVVLEYWCYDEDPVWHASDETLIETAKREFRATGLHAGHAIPEGKVVRLHRSYPVYARGYREPLARLTNWLRGVRNVSFIGRGGAFKYNNQDHSILMGLLAADNLLGRAEHDLWSVNTDSEYQEGAKIPSRSQNRA